MNLLFVWTMFCTLLVVSSYMQQAEVQTDTGHGVVVGVWQTEDSETEEGRTVSQPNRGYREYREKADDRDVAFPQLILPDQTAADVLNQRIRQKAWELLVRTRASQPQEELSYYVSYELAPAHASIRSLILQTEVNSATWAHPYAEVQALTFDERSGKIYSLPELFKPEQASMKKLNELARQQFRLATSGNESERYQGIDQEQEFYLQQDTLVLVYQRYRYTSMSPLLLEIPLSAFDGFLPSESDNNG